MDIIWDVMEFIIRFFELTIFIVMMVVILEGPDGNCVRGSWIKKIYDVLIGIDDEEALE